MSRRKLPPLAELPHRVRDRLGALPDDLRHLREGFQSDPTILWSSPLARLVFLIIGGIVAGSLLVGLVRMMTPPASPTFGEATPYATLYVACTNRDCRAHYSTQTAMDFDDWPLTCEQCGQETVYRARQCSECRRWFATSPDQPNACPFCAAKKATPPDPAEERKPAAGDDAEDPW